MSRQKVLITGASRGIGRACAQLLAENGFDLYLTCLENRGLLEAVKSRIESECPVNCDIFTCDAGNYNEMEELFKQIKDKGEPDILINNAGMMYMGLVNEMTAAEWQRVMDVNLNSVFYTCRCVIPGMVRRQSGKIINISSVWGNTGASMEVAYSTAKAGVNGFTRALARELGPSNIQVNGIAFGMIDTDMNRSLTAAELEDIYEEIPVCRAGTPKEAAHMVLQVISSPNYLTGQIITMDGGWK